MIVVLQAVTWLPMEFLIYDALGFVPLIYAIRLALSLVWLSPVLAALSHSSRLKLTVFTSVSFVALIVVAIVSNS